MVKFYRDTSYLKPFVTLVFKQKKTAQKRFLIILNFIVFT